VRRLAVDARHPPHLTDTGGLAKPAAQAYDRATATRQEKPMRHLHVCHLTALLLTLSVAGPAAAACKDCGVVSEVRIVEREGKASGAGAVAGGVGGALLGNQVGKGNGRTAMTVVGAAGGAYAGHQVEKSMNKTRAWDVAVDMEDGKQRHFSFKSEPAFRKGDKVMLRDGKLLIVAN
jgi:outer membrane lipoprotein SlyB